MAVRIRALSYFASMGVAIVLPWIGILALFRLI